MALTEDTIPYELLIRFDHVTGELKGAHICYSNRILRDGVPIPEACVPSQPAPFSMATGELSEIIGSAAIGLSAQLEEKRLEVSMLEERVLQLETVLQTG